MFQEGIDSLTIKGKIQVAGKKKCTTYIKNKGLIFLIYKELLKTKKGHLGGAVG